MPRGKEANYDCGEEVIYKNTDHIEKGVIEKVDIDKKTKDFIYDIEFRDDRKITTSRDHVMAVDETDVSILPSEAKDFIYNAKCLTREEIQQIKNPKQPSNLQREWL